MEPFETSQASPQRGAAPQQPGQKWLLFVVGFLGLYLLNQTIFFCAWVASLGPMPNYSTLPYRLLAVFRLMMKPDQFLQSFSLLANIFALPVDVMILFALAIIRRGSPIAFGMLTALALNFILSLVLRLQYNERFFLPFFRLLR